jgi:hypothetical protein
MIVATSQFDISKIDTQLAVSYMNMGGRPFAPQAQIQLPQGRLSINIDEPGSFRYHTQNILHIRASRVLIRNKTHRLLLNVAVNNILQDTGEQSLVTQNFFSPNFNVPASWIEPRQAYFQLQIR